MQTSSKPKPQNRQLKLEKIDFSIEAQRLRKDFSNRNKFNEIKHEQKALNKSKTESELKKKKKNMGNFLQATKIITVSAHKWVIYDFYSDKYIRGYRAHHKAELGVFSKLLVFCTIFTLIKRHKIEVFKFETIVTKSVLKMFPKEETLKVDDIITLEDLLHMMILDESLIYEVILSSNVGAYLHKKHKNEYYSVYDVHERTLKEHLKYFYELVNSYCQLMQLESIAYVESDPQLRKDVNKCSASDIAKLSIECLNIPLYNQILKKASHSSKIKYIDNKGHLQTKVITMKNKCIEHKFIPYLNVCRNYEENQFMSSHCTVRYDDDNVDVRPVLIVLLGCYSVMDREKDIQQIVEWYLKSEKNLKKQQLGHQNSVDGQGITNGTQSAIFAIENTLNKEKQSKGQRSSKNIIGNVKIRNNSETGNVRIKTLNPEGVQSLEDALDRKIQEKLKLNQTKGRFSIQKDKEPSGVIRVRKVNNSQAKLKTQI